VGWLTIFLIFLATFRVTRLIIEDTFPPIGVPRAKLLDFWDKHWGALGRSLAYLFTCPWCMSVWVGGGLVWATTRWVSVPMPFLVWAGTTAATGLLASLEEFLTKER